MSEQAIVVRVVLEEDTLCEAVYVGGRLVWHGDDLYAAILIDLMGGRSCVVYHDTIVGQGSGWDWPQRLDDVEPLIEQWRAEWQACIAKAVRESELPAQGRLF